MTDVYVGEPNPIVSKGVARFNTPLRMFRDNRPVAILPDSMVRKDRTCLGTSGYINEDYLYPFMLFGDIGCGTGALVFDESVELPENLPEIIREVLNEVYFEVTQEKDLNVDLTVYKGDKTGIDTAFYEKLMELRDKGCDDTYLMNFLLTMKDPRIATMADEPDSGDDGISLYSP